MSKSRSGASRRVAAGLLAGALTVLGFALAPPAGATPDATSERVAGADRFGTASAIATEAYPDGADSVIIATGRGFADALAASGLAGATGSPVLLVEPDGVPEGTAAAIDELGATAATIVGGTGVVNQAVEDELSDDLGLEVDRIAGANRYETAGLIADAIGDSALAIVASGEVAADALAAGPIAAAEGAPILLVMTNDVPTATSDRLGDATEVILVGGTARISDATATEIEDASGDTDAERLAGLNRQETAAAIGEYEVDTLGWGPTSVILAAPNSPSDSFSPDALTAGPLGGLREAPILIVESVDAIGDAADGFITDHGDTIASVIVVGGTAVISDAVEEAALATATTEEASNQTFSTDQTIQTSEQKTTAAGGTTRTCIVSGITAGTTVDVHLLPSERVTTTAGIVTLADANSNNQADLGTLGVDTFAAIVNINGTNVTPTANVNDTVSAIGSISVTIYSDTTFPADDVTVLVNADTFGGTDNDAVDLTAASPANALPKTPAEAFGVGCRTRFVPAEDLGGAFGEAGGGAEVASVDKDLNFFTVTNAGGGAAPAAATFYYDSNDTFTINGVPQAVGEAGMTAFEAALSRNDLISGTYAPDPAGISNILLTDRAPLAPTITAAPASPTSVTVTIAGEPPGAAALVDSYRILRSTGAGSTTYTQIGELSRAAVAAGATTFTDSGLTSGVTYNYVARSVSDGDESANSNIETEIPTIANADTTRPLSLDLVTTTNAGFQADLDTGDVFKVVFDSVMAAPAAGATIRVQDNDAVDPDTRADVICGTNATCALNAAAETVNGVSRAANTVLTVTLTAAPTPSTAGTVVGVQYPATVIDVLGITDLAGNVWNPVGSTDITVDGA